MVFSICACVALCHVCMPVCRRWFKLHVCLAWGEAAWRPPPMGAGWLGTGILAPLCRTHKANP